MSKKIKIYALNQDDKEIVLLLDKDVSFMFWESSSKTYFSSSVFKTSYYVRQDIDSFINDINKQIEDIIDGCL